jgi:hypothetical protein
LVIHPAESICFISGEKEKEKNEKRKKKEKGKKKKKKMRRGGERNFHLELPPDGSSCESEVSLPGCQ